jgi:FHS family L-fucose permease-like MFS transporter
MTSQQKSYVMPMIIIGALFFIFGFVTWVNGTLIPYLKIACELETDFQSFLVATAFFIAYTVMAIPASWVLSKTGYKKGMSIGLFVMAIGAIVFVPAANARDFNLFLVGLFIIGSGLALLQTASNPYASLIGPIESAAKRISIMGICNKVAGIIAGLIFGYITLKDADVFQQSLTTLDAAARDAKLDELASRVIVPYIIISGVLVVLSIGILFSSLPDIKDEDEDVVTSGAAGAKTSVLQFPHLILGVITLFLYVGVEVMAGDTIISYGKSMGIELSEARSENCQQIWRVQFDRIYGWVFIGCHHYSKNYFAKRCSVTLCYSLVRICDRRIDHQRRSLRRIYRCIKLCSFTDVAIYLAVGN